MWGFMKSTRHRLINVNTSTLRKMHQIFSYIYARGPSRACIVCKCIFFVQNRHDRYTVIKWQDKLTLFETLCLCRVLFRLLYFTSCLLCNRVVIYFFKIIFYLRKVFRELITLFILMSIQRCCPF
jgi:hypothetical protein